MLCTLLTNFQLDFLLQVGWRTADRILDVKRRFDVALDLGCGRGYVSRHVYNEMVGKLFQMDMSEKFLVRNLMLQVNRISHDRCS